MEQATAAGWWRKGPWTPQEDELLFQYISHNGEGRWSSVSKCTGLKRSGKSCRLRWVNYLRPGLKKGQLTPQEEGIIIELHALWGNKWSTIARYLPGRTDNEIKNYWRTHFKTRNPSRPKQEKRKTLFQQQQQQQKQQESQSDDANIHVSSESSSHENKDEEMMAFPSIDNHLVYQETASSSSSSDFIPMDCYLWGGLWNMDGGDDDHLRHNMPADVADYYHLFEGDGVDDYVQAAAEFLLSGN